jgi:hypothetical protein
VFLLTWEEALAVILRANSPNEFQPLDLAGQITGWQSAGEDMKTTAPLTDTGLKALSTLLPEKPTVAGCCGEVMLQYYAAIKKLSCQQTYECLKATGRSEEYCQQWAKWSEAERYTLLCERFVSWLRPALIDQLRLAPTQVAPDAMLMQVLAMTDLREHITLGYELHYTKGKDGLTSVQNNELLSGPIALTNSAKENS